MRPDAPMAPNLSTGGGCVCVDGRLLAPHEATVSALDAGLMLGDGLFESLRAIGGVPYLLERHLERLLGAAHEMSFAGVPAFEELSDQVRRTVVQARLRDAYVRVTITRGSSPAALAPPPGPATVIVAVLPAPARLQAPVQAALVAAPGGPAAGAKSTSRQHSVLASMDAQRRGAQEGIYVSEAGHVLEGISSNVFVCTGDRLRTVPQAHCLPGITRGRVLELARDAGVTAFEQPISVQTLLTAEAAFLTNAVQGLRVLGALDGQAIAMDGAGAQLFEALRERYESERTASAARGATPA
jgi:branched-chain amino acid aminotransferase